MGAGLVVLREGFEASLVVGVVLAFLKRSNRRDAFAAVWSGVLAAVALSAGVGAVLFVLGAELEGASEALFEGVAASAAAALLVWMVFWMRRQARTLRREIEGRTRVALAGGSAVALGLVVFAGVVREGMETALFLFSTTEGSSPVTSLVGGLVGLGLAVALGYALYRGAHRLDLRRFFRVTSALLLVFAGWLLARGLEELSEAGVVPAGEGVARGVLLAVAAVTLWCFFRPLRRARMPSA